MSGSIIEARIEWRVVPTVDGLATEIAPFRSDTSERVAWAPQPGSQEGFLCCPAFEVLYTGNRGGGKTACLLADFAQHVGRGYGIEWKGILFRHTYPELKDIVDKSRDLFSRIWPGVKFNETKMTFTWPSGEQLLLRHMEYEKDYLSYHGHAYPWIAWEELTTWPSSDLYQRMMSCCRSARAGMPRKIRSTTNPYGPGFNWVKERFQLPLPPGRTYGNLIPGEQGERCAINSDLRENKVFLHAEPNYIGKLKEAARNEAELAAWLHGDWTITSGGMFDDIWSRVKHRAIVPAFDVPPSWRIDRSFDWGSSRPFAVLWWAESDGSDLRFRDGTSIRTVPRDLFCIKEWYGWNGKERNKGCKMLAVEVARGIIQREIGWGLQGRVRRGIADASIFDVQNGNCIASDMSSNVVIDGVTHRGVYFDPADKRSGSRKQGWELMRKRLAAVLPERAGTPREHPGLFVTHDCPQWLQTVPSLPRDSKDLDDVDTDSEDHLGDATRYRVRKENRTVRQGTHSGL